MMPSVTLFGIERDTSTAQIRAQAIKDGIVPLMRDGMLKVGEGITTVSEVLRSVFSISYQLN